MARAMGETRGPLTWLRRAQQAYEQRRTIATLRDALQAGANGVYGRQTRWVLQNGRVMAAGEGTWTPREHEFIRNLEQGANFSKRECYANAQWALQRSLSLAAPDIRFAYCEGYAAAIGQKTPFGHAWCLLNGRVWDPSPTLVNFTNRRRYVYLGVEFLTRFLLESLERQIVRPGYSLLDNPWKDYPALTLDISQVCSPT